MPSLRTLLLVLFLAALALSIVVLFMKKSKPEQDTQSYAKQNPTCDEIKKHSKKNDMMECFLNFESASDFPVNLEGEDTLYIPMAKFIGERFPEEFPLRVRYVSSFPGETIDSVGISGKNINIARGKNSVWRDEKGCKFPGPCPVSPLRDGDSVNAILPGKIIKIEKDSLYNITIYHGENIYSKTGNLKTLSDYAQIGKIITPDFALGFLPNQHIPLDFVEITRNGKRIELNKFIEESW